MGERWIKEAEDLRSNGQSGTMLRNHNAPKVTWHVTVSPSGGSWFTAMHRVLTSNKSEPHILYDPVTDRLGQYFPLDRSARALANDGSRPTNRDGTINIQIEVVAMPDGFTRYWKPGPNYAALMRVIRSWGIPDTWPAGVLASSPSHNVTRSWSRYRQSGHFGHSNVPGNDHWDPGPINRQAIFSAATGSSSPAPAPSRSSRSLRATWKGKQVMAHGVFSPGTIKRLQAETGATIDGIAGPNTWRAVQKWAGATPDGIRGPETVRAIQRKVGARRLTGRWTPWLVRALQRHLNTRAWTYKRT